MPAIVSITCVELDPHGKPFDTMFHIPDADDFKDEDVIPFASGIWFGASNYSKHIGRNGFELIITYDDRTLRTFAVGRGSHGGPDIVER